MLNLEYIIENSGDSTFESYIYSGGILTINLNLSDIDKKVLIKIRTDGMSFKNYYLDREEDLYRTCRIEIQELSNVLSVKNDMYVPSSIFENLMNEKRFNYHLASGEETTTVKYIFSLVGYDRLVSCLVSDLDCIALEEIN